MVIEKKNVENNVMDEVKRLGINLVPFLPATNKGKKMLENIDPEYVKNPKTPKDYTYWGISFCSSSITLGAGVLTVVGGMLLGVAYVSDSMKYKTLNFNKWEDIRQERVVRQEDYKARVLDGAFGVLDSDGDGVLSRGEFGKMGESVERNSGVYSRLSNGLDLEEGYDGR